MSKRNGVIASIIVLLGLSVFLYPLIAELINAKIAEKAVTRYERSVREQEESLLTAQKEEAEIYNRTIPRNCGIIHEVGYTADVGTDVSYENALCLDERGVMASLSIPKIGLLLPIYHYASETQLQKGVGHIYGTSLPIGGEGHCVLTGHRGLPSSELFTRLDEMCHGDTFQITCLGETCVYRITRILTVLPSEVSDISVIPGKDLVSLVTCTPYGLNTHRLIITGERVYGADIIASESSQAIKKNKSKALSEQWRIYVAIGLLLFWSGTLAILFSRKADNMKKRTLIGIGSLLCTIGILVIVYPVVKNNARKEAVARDYANYKAAADSRPKTKYEAYNESKSAEDYENCDAFIGYLKAPSIDLMLPVYRGTSEETLEKGAGHLFGSDLPDTASSSNCVLCSHNGLVGNELFLRLPELKEGDPVYMQVGDKEICYTVTSTEVVEAGANVYAVTPDEVMLTLCTCTPIGVNTHRLLVHCMVTHTERNNES